MIVEILNNSAREILRRIQLARLSLSAKIFPPEIMPCEEWVVQTLNSLEDETQRITSYLALNLSDKILEQTWYNELVTINYEIEVLESYFIHPLYRMSEEDRLALMVIEWLHKSHNQTISKQFILSNGNFSIAPSSNSPTLYWLPVTCQFSLLYMSLFFHEFGHLLFLNHKEEMEVLIREFQDKLAEHLSPSISQSDEKYQSYVDKAADIVETWREWMEELFCDAVGLLIGGKAYLLAFSNFIRLGGLKEFFIAEKYLSKRSHPVSLLRIKFLIERANEIGLGNETEVLENEWKKLATTLSVNEDYFGFFEDRFKNDIASLIDDMITEANPITFNDISLQPIKNIPDKNFIQIINEAWDKYLSTPEEFNVWEKGIIKKIVAK